MVVNRKTIPRTVTIRNHTCDKISRHFIYNAKNIRISTSSYLGGCSRVVGCTVGGTQGAWCHKLWGETSPQLHSNRLAHQNLGQGDKCKLFMMFLVQWAHKETWFVMYGGRSCILHYGPLIVTNNLYSPTPNVQSPSASLNKINPPLRNCPYRNPLLSWS